MPDQTSRQRLHDPCIICGKKEGTIRIADGKVCNACMPIELLPQAQDISRTRLIIYRRLNSGYTPCTEASMDDTGQRVSIDRSMAITPGSSVVLADELNASIAGSETVDIVVSFIRMTGLNLLIDSLRSMADRGGRIRVITTAYMGNTEYEAIVALSKLKGAEVRMELDVGRKRIHAKAMLFGRGGDCTAYVGSANISASALTTGEEWVVKIRKEDAPEVVYDLERAYERLWRSSDLIKVDENNRARIEQALECGGRYQ